MICNTIYMNRIILAFKQTEKNIKKKTDTMYEEYKVQ